jgi:hypothetical protein
LLFRVEFIGTPSSQVSQYFALDDIWYSSEDGKQKRTNVTDTQKKIFDQRNSTNDLLFVGFTVSPQIDTIPVPTVTPTAPATTTKAGNFS